MTSRTHPQLLLNAKQTKQREIKDGRRKHPLDSSVSLYQLQIPVFCCGQKWTRTVEALWTMTLMEHGLYFLSAMSLKWGVFLIVNLNVIMKLWFCHFLFLSRSVSRIWFDLKVLESWAHNMIAQNHKCPHRGRGRHFWRLSAELDKRRVFCFHHLQWRGLVWIVMSLSSCLCVVVLK